jgi:hypothetical protein
MSSSERSAIIKAYKDRGYTHYYIYAYNENDYSGPSFDYYKNPQGFKEILQQIVNAGLKPVVWLNPDDAPVNKNRSEQEIKSRMNALIPIIDSLVSSYVLGLELDEYWSKSKSDSLGNHLNTLTSKPLAAHQIGGKWDYCKSSWCDYMILQYGFGKTEAQIISMTKEAISDLKKPIVAGEYNSPHYGEGLESLSVKLGNAGISAGASGFGNGGTAPKPTKAPTSVPKPTYVTPTLYCLGGCKVSPTLSKPKSNLPTAKISPASKTNPSSVKYSPTPKQPAPSRVTTNNPSTNPSSDNQITILIITAIISILALLISVLGKNAPEQLKKLIEELKKIINKK